MAAKLHRARGVIVDVHLRLRHERMLEKHLAEPCGQETGGEQEVVGPLIKRIGSLCHPMTETFWTESPFHWGPPGALSVADLGQLRVRVFFLAVVLLVGVGGVLAF